MKILIIICIVLGIILALFNMLVFIAAIRINGQISLEEDYGVLNSQEGQKK